MEVISFNSAGSWFHRVLPLEVNFNVSALHKFTFYSLTYLFTYISSSCGRMCLWIFKCSFANCCLFKFVYSFWVFILCFFCIYVWFTQYKIYLLTYLLVYLLTVTKRRRGRLELSGVKIKHCSSFLLHVLRFVLKLRYAQNTKKYYKIIVD